MQFREKQQPAKVIARRRVSSPRISGARGHYSNSGVNLPRISAGKLANIVVDFLRPCSRTQLATVPLPSVSLWYDELQSVTIAYRSFPLSFLSSIAYDPHPPLYNLLLSAWLQLGQSDSTIILSS